MTGRFKQALLEMKKSKKGRKGKMPKNFSVSSGDKSKAGGLTKKGVKRYRAANPGSELKTAVTTKPSKLKKGSKSAKRRKSFCKRMGGMKKKLTSKKTASNPDSRINKALRKWNCSTDVNPNALQQMAEMILKRIQENGILPQRPRAGQAARARLARQGVQADLPTPKHTTANTFTHGSRTAQKTPGSGGVATHRGGIPEPDQPGYVQKVRSEFPQQARDTDSRGSSSVGGKDAEKNILRSNVMKAFRAQPPEMQRRTTKKQLADYLSRGFEDDKNSPESKRARADFERDRGDD
jgi:hypothetical protein